MTTRTNIFDRQAAPRSSTQGPDELSGRSTGFGISQDSAVEVFEKNRQRAQVYKDQGVDNSDGFLDKILRGSAGFLQSTGLDRALSFLNRGRTSIVLGAQDILQFDQRYGYEISAADYGDILTKFNGNERVEERILETPGAGPDAVTGLLGHNRDISASTLWSNIGWQTDFLDDAPWWINAPEELARFVVAFGTDMAADPLTYVTAGYGGLGRPAVSKIVQGTIKKMARSTVDDIIEVATKKGLRSAPAMIDRKVAEGVYSTLQARAAHETVERATKLLGQNVPLKNAVIRGAGFSDTYVAQAGKKAGQTLKEIEIPKLLDDLTALPLENTGPFYDRIRGIIDVVETKQFGSKDKYWREWIDFVEGGFDVGRTSGNARNLNWTTGGLRFGIMQKSVRIPGVTEGTRGAVRKSLSIAKETDVGQRIARKMESRLGDKWTQLRGGFSKERQAQIQALKGKSPLDLSEPLLIRKIGLAKLLKAEGIDDNMPLQVQAKYQGLRRALEETFDENQIDGVLTKLDQELGSGAVPTTPIEAGRPVVGETMPGGHKLVEDQYGKIAVEDILGEPYVTNVGGKGPKSRDVNGYQTTVIEDGKRIHRTFKEGVEGFDPEMQKRAIKNTANIEADRAALQKRKFAKAETATADVPQPAAGPSPIIGATKKANQLAQDFHKFMIELDKKYAKLLSKFPEFEEIINSKIPHSRYIQTDEFMNEMSDMVNVDKYRSAAQKLLRGDLEETATLLSTVDEVISVEDLQLFRENFEHFGIRSTKKRSFGDAASLRMRTIGRGVVIIDDKMITTFANLNELEQSLRRTLVAITDQIGMPKSGAGKRLASGQVTAVHMNPIDQINNYVQQTHQAIGDQLVAGELFRRGVASVGNKELREQLVMSHLEQSGWLKDMDALAQGKKEGYDADKARRAMARVGEDVVQLKNGPKLRLHPAITDDPTFLAIHEMLQDTWDEMVRANDQFPEMFRAESQKIANQFGNLPEAQVQRIALDSLLTGIKDVEAQYLSDITTILHAVREKTHMQLKDAGIDPGEIVELTNKYIVDAGITADKAYNTYRDQYIAKFVGKDVVSADAMSMPIAEALDNEQFRSYLVDASQSYQQRAVAAARQTAERAEQTVASLESLGAHPYDVAMERYKMEYARVRAEVTEAVTRGESVVPTHQVSEIVMPDMPGIEQMQAGMSEFGVTTRTHKHAGAKPVERLEAFKSTDMGLFFFDPQWADDADEVFLLIRWAVDGKTVNRSLKGGKAAAEVADWWDDNMVQVVQGLWTPKKMSKTQKPFMVVGNVPEDQALANKLVNMVQGQLRENTVGSLYVDFPSVFAADATPTWAKTMTLEEIAMSQWAIRTFPKGTPVHVKKADIVKANPGVFSPRREYLEPGEKAASRRREFSPLLEFQGKGKLPKRVGVRSIGAAFDRDRDFAAKSFGLVWDEVDERYKHVPGSIEGVAFDIYFPYMKLTGPELDELGSKFPRSHLEVDADAFDWINDVDGLEASVKHELRLLGVDDESIVDEIFEEYHNSIYGIDTNTQYDFGRGVTRKPTNLNEYGDDLLDIPHRDLGDIIREMQDSKTEEVIRSLPAQDFDDNLDEFRYVLPAGTQIRTPRRRSVRTVFPRSTKLDELPSGTVTKQKEILPQSPHDKFTKDSIFERYQKAFNAEGTNDVEGLPTLPPEWFESQGQQARDAAGARPWFNPETKIIIARNPKSLPKGEGVVDVGRFSGTIREGGFANPYLTPDVVESKWYKAREAEIGPGPDHKFTAVKDVNTAVERYKNDLWEKIDSDAVFSDKVAALSGKTLTYFRSSGRTGGRSHSDVLADAADYLASQKRSSTLSEGSVTRAPRINVTRDGGDEFGSQFSAMNADLRGKKLEQVWQQDVKQSGKGKAPKDKTMDTELEYARLWNEWKNENRDLFDELAERVIAGEKLVDEFSPYGSGKVSQARALTRIAWVQKAGNPAGDQYPRPVKIISGGQEGADLMGLEVGIELGLETGGTAPKGYRVDRGKNPSLQSYDLVEDASSEYPPRTLKNVDEADATVVYGNQLDSGGTTITRRFAAGERKVNGRWKKNQADPKPYIENPTPEELVEFLETHNVQTLNVAGNRNKTGFDPAMGDDFYDGLRAYIREEGAVVDTPDVPIARDIRTAPSASSIEKADFELQGLWDDLDAARAANDYEAIGELTAELEFNGAVVPEAPTPISPKDVDLADLPAHRPLTPPPPEGASIDELIRWKADDEAASMSLWTADDEVTYRDLRNELDRAPVINKEIDAPAGLASGEQERPVRRVTGGQQNDPADLYSTTPLQAAPVDEGELAQSRRTIGHEKQALGRDGKNINSVGEGYDPQMQTIEHLVDQDVVNMVQSFTKRLVSRSERSVEDYLLDVHRSMLTKELMEGVIAPIRRGFTEAGGQTMQEFGVDLGLVARQIRYLELGNPEAILDPQLQKYISIAMILERGDTVTADTLVDQADELLLHFNVRIDQFNEVTNVTTQELTRTKAASDPSQLIEIVDQSKTIGRTGTIEERIDEIEAFKNLYVDSKDDLQHAVTELLGSEYRVGLSSKGEEGIPVLFIDAPRADRAVLKEKWNGHFDEALDAMARGEVTRDDAIKWGIPQLALAHDASKKLDEVLLSAPHFRGEAATAARNESMVDYFREIVTETQKAIDNGNAVKLRNRTLNRNLKTGAFTPNDEFNHVLEALAPYPENQEWLRRYVESGYVAGLENAWTSDEVFAAWWQEQRHQTAALEGSLNSHILTFNRILDKIAEPPPGFRASEEIFRELVTQGQSLRRFTREVSDIPVDEGQLPFLSGFASGTDAERLGDYQARVIGGQENLVGTLEKIQDWLKLLGDESNDPGKVLGDIAGRTKEGAAFSPKKLREMEKALHEGVFQENRFWHQTYDPDKVPVAQVGLDAGVFAENVGIDPAFVPFLETMFNNQQVIYTPYAVSQTQGLLRQMHNIWKASATVARPSFHIRNWIGGVSNGFIAGVRPLDYWAVYSDIRTMRRGLRKLALDGVEDMDVDVMDLVWRELSDKNRQMFKDAWSQDIFQTSFTRAEHMYDPTAGLSVKPWETNFVLFSKGGQTMEYVEDWLRMATFHRWYEEGGGEASNAAAKSIVNAVHFDYTDLTSIEEKIKVVMPFYVWSRRNIPLQLRTLTQNPTYMMWYYRARSNWNEQQLEGLADDDPFARYAANSGFIMPFTRNNDYGQNRMMWDPQLPSYDLDLFPWGEGPTGWLNPMWVLGSTVDQLGPGLSLPFTLSQQAQEAGGTGTNARAGLNAVIHSLNQVGLLNTEIIGANPTDSLAPDVDYRVSKWINGVMSTAIPYYDDWRAFLGIKPNNPYRSAGEGWLPGEQPGIATRITLGPLGRTLGRGAGVGWYTPQDAFFEADAVREEMDRRRLAYRFSIGDENPEIEYTDDEIAAILNP